MKLWNKCICLTSRKTMMVLTALLISTLVIASVWSDVEPILKENPTPPVEEVEETENLNLIAKNKNISTREILQYVELSKDLTK